jgi:hypothetical protein
MVLRRLRWGALDSSSPLPRGDRYTFDAEVGTEIWSLFTVHYTPKHGRGSIRPNLKSASWRGSA